MSGSSQHDRVALVSADEQELIGEILNAVHNGISYEETHQRLVRAQEVLL